MTIQMKDTVRNAMLNAIEALGASGALEIRVGAQPATCIAARSGAILATILLPAGWLTAAASGAVSIEGGPWTDASADNTGTAGHFCIYNSQATKDGTTCIMQGTVGISASDMIVDSVSFTAGQSFSINSFTLTAGNA